MHWGEQMLSKLLTFFFSFRQELRFFLVGGANTVIGLAFFAGFFLLLEDLWIPSFILYFSSFFSITISFFTLKHLVFRSNGKFIKEYPRTFIVQVLSLALNGIFLDLIVVSWKIHPLIAQPFLILFIAMMTYFAHKFYSFK